MPPKTTRRTAAFTTQSEPSPTDPKPTEAPLFLPSTIADSSDDEATPKTSPSKPTSLAPVASMAPPPLPTASARPHSRTDIAIHSGTESEQSDNDYDSDDDPVVRTYDVFTTSELSEFLYLFQYPVRPAAKPYTKAQNCCPVDARVKAKSGLVEIDVPVNVKYNFDEEKGRIWGDVLRRVKQSEIASGIVGKAAVAGKGGKRRKVKEEDDEEEELDTMTMPFEEAEKRGRIMNKQTLGSKMQPEETKYMLGVFKDDQLHLTPIKSTVQLRPQFPHVDAQLAQERAATKALRDLDAADKPAEAKAVHLSVKNTADPNSQLSSTMKALRLAEEEEWRHMHWIDQDDEGSWDQYEFLRLKDTEGAQRLKPTTTKQEYMDWLSGKMRYGAGAGR
ncbi:hypothetical protein EX30DRAFT_337532 [Ascodesmis nigricans]|uniref:DNA-directed RNA polymerase III subunit Rpc5 n=1 Tax=Ascodesmis nigricans TaxID=341454 RepID=A0A4S2N7F6_9PEZI|nr:hypothetical protein EX30DRAFT_337532 [Ascodesmis nigricans]